MALEEASFLVLLTGAALLVLLVTFVFRVIVIFAAVNILGGETTFVRTLLIELLLSVAASIVPLLIPLGNFIMPVATVIVYMIAYRLGLIKAVIALALIFIITVIVPILMLYFGAEALAS